MVEKQSKGGWAAPATTPVKKAPPPAGAKPELKWIKVSDLFIDHAYQRNAQSKASVKSLQYLQENFSWAHCGALLVCFVPAKKKYAVIDGQHRLMAALTRGDIPEMPCVVISGHDFQDQAKSFIVINTKRVRLNSLAAFHAAVAAGDPDSVALQNLLKDCKIEIPRNPVLNGDTAPRQTQAVGTLLKMCGKYSKKQMTLALTVIPEAYGEERGMMRASLIKALAAFVKNQPDVDRARLVYAVGDIDVEKLESDARAYVGVRGGSPIDAMVEMLGRVYSRQNRKRVA